MRVREDHNLPSYFHHLTACHIGKPATTRPDHAKYSLALGFPANSTCYFGLRTSISASKRRSKDQRSGPLPTHCLSRHSGANNGCPRFCMADICAACSVPTTLCAAPTRGPFWRPEGDEAGHWCEVIAV